MAGNEGKKVPHKQYPVLTSNFNRICHVMKPKIVQYWDFRGARLSKQIEGWDLIKMKPSFQSLTCPNVAILVKGQFLLFLQRSQNGYYLDFY